MKYPHFPTFEKFPTWKDYITRSFFTVIPTGMLAAIIVLLVEILSRMQSYALSLPTLSVGLFLFFVTLGSYAFFAVTPTNKVPEVLSFLTLIFGFLYMGLMVYLFSFVIGGDFMARSDASVSRTSLFFPAQFWVVLYAVTLVPFLLGLHVWAMWRIPVRRLPVPLSYLSIGVLCIFLPIFLTFLFTLLVK